jgi:hypothetical protein
MRSAFRSLVFAGLAAASISAFAQQSGSLRIEFLGPGGHSSNNYGRTSPLHAAGRTAIGIQKSLPPGSYVITNEATLSTASPPTA